MLKISKSIQKSSTLSTFPSSHQRNFEDSVKVLAVSVSEFTRVVQFSSINPYAYKMVITTVCV